MTEQQWQKHLCTLPFFFFFWRSIEWILNECRWKSSRALRLHGRHVRYSRSTGLERDVFFFFSVFTPISAQCSSHLVRLSRDSRRFLCECVFKITREKRWGHTVWDWIRGNTESGYPFHLHTTAKALMHSVHKYTLRLRPDIELEPGKVTCHISSRKTTTTGGKNGEDRRNLGSEL